MTRKIDLPNSGLSANDYVSLSFIEKKFGGKNGLIESWLNQEDTIELFKVWEAIYSNEFEPRLVKKLSIKQWIEKTFSRGLIFEKNEVWAHQDIAIDFRSWLSPDFRYFVIYEFQRLHDKAGVQIDIKK